MKAFQVEVWIQDLRVKQKNMATKYYKVLYITRSNQSSMYTYSNQKLQFITDHHISSYVIQATLSNTTFPVEILWET